MVKRRLCSLVAERADRILGVTAAAVAAAGGAGIVGTTATVEADIVYSGPINLAVPDTIDGLYLNVVTGATGSTGGSVAGWDVNPYSALAGQFNLWGFTTTTWFSTGTIAGPYNQPIGTAVDGTGAFFRPGGGTDIGPQMNLNSDQNYLGFQFTNEAAGNQIQYGWMQFQFGATAGERSIIGYAYEDSGGGIAIGVIPEPSTFGLLALGAVGLATMRRRRSA